MKIQFNIHYNTYPGQQMVVTGNVKGLGNNDPERSFHLNYQSDGYWNGSIELSEQTLKINYKYVLLQPNGEALPEWGPDRKIALSGIKSKSLRLFNTWRYPGKEELALFNAAFKDVILRANAKEKGSKAASHSWLEFRMMAPRIGENFQLCLSGNQPSMGNWDPEKPLLLETGEDAPLWHGSTDLAAINWPIEYKYGIYDPRLKKVVTLEEGNNRKFNFLEDPKDESSIIKSDESFRYPIGNWKGAGVSVPVFSLRTKTGFGIGEFTDLIPFITWAKKVGLKMVQILPINDTTAYHNWLDSYPYKSISVMALHPALLNLEKAGILLDKTQREKFAKKKEKLNVTVVIDFPEIMKVKLDYLRLLFNQEKEKFFKKPAFTRFFKANSQWLVPYAAYCYLRDKMKTPDFREWKEFSVYDSQKIQKLTDPGSKVWDKIAIHYFIQFHLDKQLSDVAAFARQNGVVLKGDIPIGISPTSVEAWTEPHLFHLDGQAGAPPDDFAIKGQNWGFPTYNWEAMAKEKYHWWKNRLQNMSKYFDAYRIDHILGFFRIWEIPMDAVEGILGHFNPCIPLSTEEILQYGISFDFDRMTKPYIRQHNLPTIFGPYTDEAIHDYLEMGLHGYCFLKEEFDTQQKINGHFLNGKVEEELTDKDRTIRNGLFDLVSNVLFVPLNHHEWHPRVSMQQTSSFAELDESDRNKLNQLYNDFYFRRHNDFWYWKAMEKLPTIIGASDMLVCGEDLGMVPDCVQPVMDALHILSLEIQRMPKNPKVEFAHPADAPYLSVCTSSTHDMSTIRGWWEEDREKTQRFFNHHLGNEGPAPFFAEPWICEQIIKQHLFSPAMWVTLPVQDLIALDGDFRWENTQAEQINVPANPRHRWQFRMKQDVDELLGADRFNQLLKKLVELTGRNSAY